MNSEQAPINNEDIEQAEGAALPAVADSAPSSALVLVEAYKAAGTMRLSEEQEAILLAPVDPDNDVELHPINGPYIPWIKYTQRLNKAFGLMGWARLRMGEPDFDPEFMTAAVRVALKVEGRVVRDAVGECKQGSKKMTQFDCLEGAMKNGLKRCCSDLGMFAELHDRRWREQWLVSHARKTKKDGYDQWERVEGAAGKSSPLPPAADLLTEGIVKKVKVLDAATKKYLVTVESEMGSVDVVAKEPIAKYADPTLLVDTWVQYRVKQVPVRGGGQMTVFDHFAVLGQP